MVIVIRKIQAEENVLTRDWLARQDAKISGDISVIEQCLPF